MRDSYYAAPVRDLIDSMLARVSCSAQDNANLFALSWELELLLLDDRSPERQWRQALTGPLQKLQSAMSDIAWANEPTADTPVPEPLDISDLITELAY